MERIIYIYSFLILLSLFVIIYHFNKKPNKNIIYNEKFNFYESNKNTPNYIKNYLNNKVSSHPDYNKENINQFNYNRLYEKLQLINEEKIKLEGPFNYEKYITTTTDDKLRRDLDNISEYVLLILNQDRYYNFSKTNYGNVEIYYNKNNSANYIYELFLWDKKNYFQIKLLIDIIKIPKKSYIHKYGIKQKKYIFNDFNIGIPSKDQLIPLPLDVIPTQNKKLCDEVYKNDPLKPKYFYLNQIKIENSTLIVNSNKNNFNNNKMKINEFEFSGTNDMSLEYIGYQGSNNPTIQKSKFYNKWPILDEEPKWKGQYPAKTPPQSWDVDGVYYYSNKDKFEASQKDKYCDLYDSGTIWSPMKMPLQPYSRPTLATIPRNCGENYWLFNSQGPDGTFFGGGKK